MGHKTRTKWSNRQETGTSYTVSTAYTSGRGHRSQYSPKGNAPDFGLPIKRIKKTAGVLLILFFLWALIYGLRVL